jgi:hypothetical protein
MTMTKQEQEIYERYFIRLMGSSGDSRCTYCNHVICVSDFTAKAPGVIGGHIDCVQSAFKTHQLMRKMGMWETLPPALEEFTLPQTGKNALTPWPPKMRSVHKKYFYPSRSRARCPCPYCKNDIYENDVVLRAVGIKTGHKNCVKRAFETRQLIIGNPHLVPQDLSEFALQDQFSTPSEPVKEPLPNYSFCLHFEPKLIQVLSLPEERELNECTIQELNSSQREAAENVIWDRFLEKWIAEYKRPFRELPFCPVHQWSTDPADHVMIHIQQMGDKKRGIWWCCPATS